MLILTLGIVAVAQVPKLLDKVVPENQNMDKDYSGKDPNF